MSVTAFLIALTSSVGFGVWKEILSPKATTALNSGLSSYFLKAGLPLASITPSSS